MDDSTLGMNSAQQPAKGSDVVGSNELDLDSIRRKLAGTSGVRYWRTLEEVAETPQFQQFLDDEFPNRSTLLQINRRDMLKFMGASIALAGLSGCRGVFLPQDKVVPYVRQPEELVPGNPLFYASTMLLGGYGTGVLVEQHMGRPTKIEGNPLHPASLGASDSVTQAELLNLYDPDRMSAVMRHGDLSTWETFELTLGQILFQQNLFGGEGMRILTGAVTSPTTLRLIEAIKTKYPGMTWHSYEPAGLDNVRAGAEIAFGRPVNVVYDFSQADVILSLDADFLSATEFPGSLAYSRQYASKRRVEGKTGQMNRVYALESTPALVGSVADHRWPVRASDMAGVASGIMAAIGLGIGSDTDAIPNEAFSAIVEDLQANQGNCLVVAGKHLPAEVHAAVHKINEALGNFGKTVTFTSAVEANVARRAGTIQQLVEAMNARQVQVLLMLDTNPVYTAPSDLKFAEALKNVQHTATLCALRDESAMACEWALPLSHSLESWGDARSYEGTISLVQPIIAPLFEGRSAIELLSVIAGTPAMGYDLVKETVRQSGLAGDDLEKFWRRCVHDGVIPGTAFKPVAMTVLDVEAPAQPGAGFEVVFRPDPSIYDGRFANNGWLQELPKPINKLTWDNAAILSPSKARELGVKDSDMVLVSVNGAELKAAVLVQPGQPKESVTLHLGYGRTAGGPLATARGEDGGGFNSYLLRTSGAMGFALGATVTKTEGIHTMASTQGHNILDDSRIRDRRDIIREWTLPKFQENIDEWLERWAEKTREYHEADMFPEKVFEWNGSQWGMTIDMNLCTGCNACVTACQAENNISVVGKLQVQRHREMHWIRIDRYYSGDYENPTLNWQPLMCVHCEKAPCEPVCPVAATVHSQEGLNQMVYNRCVGTRYCSNNCPYRVRRYNYLNWSDNQPNFAQKVTPWRAFVSENVVPGRIHADRANGRAMLRMINNPDVTVRGRGVMEKCTYCVQRINEARIEAKKQGRMVADGEIVTACQQACPTQSIIFGDIADSQSQVAKWRKDPRAYLLLEELLTVPRTSHLARLKNPNPKIPMPEKAGEQA